MGALIQHFSLKGNENVIVQSKLFLNHFIKVGVDLRARDNVEIVRKTYENNLRNKRIEKDRIDAQFAKLEVEISMDFDISDLDMALYKLTEASINYDPQNPAGIGLRAFTNKSLRPQIFREMLKRSFSISLSDPELASLVCNGTTHFFFQFIFLILFNFILFHFSILSI